MCGGGDWGEGVYGGSRWGYVMVVGQERECVVEVAEECWWKGHSLLFRNEHSVRRELSKI